MRYDTQLANGTSGARDKFVAIQRLVPAVETPGFPVETWQTVGYAWMSREMVKGVERVQAAQVSAKYDARWGMPYRKDMDPDLVDVPKERRLVFMGRVHDITAAEQVGREHGIELTTMTTTKVPS